MSRTGLPSICMNGERIPRALDLGMTSLFFTLIIQDDRELTLARIALVQGVVTVIALDWRCGVEAPRKCGNLAAVGRKSPQAHFIHRRTDTEPVMTTTATTLSIERPYGRPTAPNEQGLTRWRNSHA